MLLLQPQFMNPAYCRRRREETQNSTNKQHEANESFGVRPLGCSDRSLGQSGRHPKGWTPNGTIHRQAHFFPKQRVRVSLRRLLQYAILFAGSLPARAYTSNDTFTAFSAFTNVF